MQKNRDVVLSYIFRFEGGFVNHPSDPGGATNMGITQETLSAWRGHQVSVEDVRDLKKSEATDIYEAEYLRKVRFADLPSGLDFTVVDFAVNSGVSRASRYLQALVGSRQDGIIGPDTLRKTFARADIDNYGSFLIEEMIMDYCDHRLNFLRRLKTWSTFGDGWRERVATVNRVSRDLAKVY